MLSKRFKNIFKKEYEYDFFGTIFIIGYKFIVSIVLIMALGIYLLPLPEQFNNPENQTYLLMVGALMLALGLLAEYLFIRVKDGTEENFLNYIDSIWERMFK